MFRHTFFSYLSIGEKETDLALILFFFFPIWKIENYLRRCVTFAEYRIRT